MQPAPGVFGVGPSQGQLLAGGRCPTDYLGHAPRPDALEHRGLHAFLIEGHLLPGHGDLATSGVDSGALVETSEIKMLGRASATMSRLSSTSSELSASAGLSGEVINLP
jgi:hypothetical protein